MKRSPSLVSREIQMKTTPRHYYIPTNVDKTEKGVE